MPKAGGPVAGRHQLNAARAVLEKFTASAKDGATYDPLIDTENDQRPS